MNYIVDIYKLILASICAFLFGALSVILLILQYWIIGGIFVAFFAIYLIIAIKNGYMIRVDENNVCRIFPRSGMALGWNDIREVGVAGIKVFGRAGRKHTGTKYIYFSDHKLTDEELFDLCLKWPPKNMLYMRFNQKRIAAVQRLWADEIRMYNTGSLHF